MHDLLFLFLRGYGDRNQGEAGDRRGSARVDFGRYAVTFGERPQHVQAGATDHGDDTNGAPQAPECRPRPAVFLLGLLMRLRVFLWCHGRVAIEALASVKRPAPWPILP